MLLMVLGRCVIAWTKAGLAAFCAGLGETARLGFGIANFGRQLQQPGLQAYCTSHAHDKRQATRGAKSKASSSRRSVLCFVARFGPPARFAVRLFVSLCAASMVCLEMPVARISRIRAGRQWTMQSAAPSSALSVSWVRGRHRDGRQQEGD